MLKQDNDLLYIELEIEFYESELHDQKQFSLLKRKMISKLETFMERNNISAYQRTLHRDDENNGGGHMGWDSGRTEKEIFHYECDYSFFIKDGKILRYKDNKLETDSISNYTISIENKNGPDCWYIDGVDRIFDHTLLKEIKNNKITFKYFIENDKRSINCPVYTF